MVGFDLRVVVGIEHLTVLINLSVWIGFHTMDHSIDNIKEENMQTNCNKVKQPPLKYNKKNLECLDGLSHTGLEATQNNYIENTNKKIQTNCNHH